MSKNYYKLHNNFKKLLKSAKKMSKKEKDNTISKEKNSAQVLFMQNVKAALPANISIVEELSDLLGVSQDSAYRRIRGETVLSIEEITLLCDKYKISFDTFIHTTKGNTVNFSYNPLKGDPESFHDYLIRILADLKKLSSFPNSQIIYSAVDIPVFHHFNFPVLSAFKTFYWCRSILNIPQLQTTHFNINALDKKISDTAKEIYQEYGKINSVEIWSEETVNSTLRQIEFFWDSGAFNKKEDALQVCEEVKQMFENVKRMASENSKIAAGKRSTKYENNFSLYSSEVTIGNNCILTTVGENYKAAYLSYHTFNTMLTTNASFCNETENWLKNIMKKSIMISGVGEKQRHQFFRKTDEELEKLTTKISSS